MTTERKVCTRCKVEKPLEGFYRQTAGRFGRNPECIPCFNARTKAYYERTKHWANPQSAIRQRERQLRKLGVEEEGTACAICGAAPDSERNGLHKNGYQPGSKPRRLAIDHDHETGEFRGFLCHMCNAALGCAGDDPRILRAMADYLEVAELEKTIDATVDAVQAALS